MKPLSQPGNPAFQPSASLHYRLNMYALMASAAGMGVLASVPAEAHIVYTRVHHTIRPKHTYQLDLNHDGIADFTIINLVSCNQDYCVDYLHVQGSGANAAQGAPGFLGIPYAYALTRLAKVGPGQPFAGKMMASYGEGTIGRWVNVTSRYLGLKFQIKGKTHYGWARLDVSFNGSTFKALVRGYAYETVANKPIRAGKAKSGDAVQVSRSVANPTVAVGAPSPATLGALALGSPGLSIWRRKESARVTN